MSESFKKKISTLLIKKMGYGRTYRFSQFMYRKSKQIIKRVGLSYKRILINSPISNNVLNLTTEAEIRALAYQNYGLYSQESNYKVSIIIAIRNEKVDFKKLLSALINNTTYPNYDIHVVDISRSTLNKKYILNLNNKKINYYKINENKSYSQLIDYGVKVSNGELLLILDSNTIPLYGWLDEMIRSYRSIGKCGVVGARLIYREVTNLFRYNDYIGCSIKHDGVRFQNYKRDVIPYSIGRNMNPLYDNHEQPTEVPSVDGACMLVNRMAYKQIGGLDNQLPINLQSIDFSLSLIKLGYRNVVSHKALVFQDINSNKRQNREFTNRGFNAKWNQFLRINYWNEKLSNSNSFWSESALKIAFLVTENNTNTTAGDLFSARGLGESLREMYGYDVIYIPQQPMYEWDVIPKSVDIVISMLPDFDIRATTISNKTIKLAWIRGNFEQWLQQSSLTDYDGILTSSEYLMNKLRNEIVGEKCWGVIPLGVTKEFYSYSHDSERDIDISFVGNIYNIPRDVVRCLDVKKGYNFHFYGSLEAKEDHPWVPFHKGPIRYQDIPELYRRSKIVIEDTAPYNQGTVNLRLFEAAASGALVISNENLAIKELLYEEILYYKSKEDLNKQIDYFLLHEDERIKMAHRMREIVLKKHTFKERAKLAKTILIDHLV